ncbi:cytochrome P450 [Phakopsora pachyrhizi]|uniref:Cytochrome P450 n=1 Tax=Phakopsora pachyrhizi TaxID=170000 RepID=A0AAV0B144_PHAPC|nr:cytochrome P450 [Phakopsora pachyrhizi]
MPLSVGDWLIVCTLSCFVYIFINYRNRAIGTTKRKDPNFQDASGWPLLGNLIGTFVNRNRPLEWATIRSLQKSPGLSITLPWLRLIDISKPEWVEYVQKTNFQNYVKGNLFQEVVADVFGDGIFASDGETWKKTRHSTSAIFTTNSFKTIMEPSVDRSLKSMLHIMELAAKKNHSIDFCDIFFKFTLESFLSMSFGVNVDLILGTLQLENNTENITLQSSTNLFAEAFDFVQNQLDFRFSVIKGWKFLEGIMFPTGRKMNMACDFLDRYAYYLIDQRISASGSGRDIKEKSDSYQEDLLGLFMQARDHRGGGLNRTELKDAVINLIIAGRDTTAQALSWAFFHLVMNPEVIEKVRQETVDVLESEGDEHVNYENFRQLVWTQAVAYETLRLHPSVPKNVKFALKKDVIPGGPVIEAGDAVRWSDWQMGRDPRIWGPDCGEFRPDRWINSQGKLNQFGQFKFHAFNGGPRICLGMKLAIFEIVTVVVEVLKRFNLEFAPGWLLFCPTYPEVLKLRLQQVPKSEPIPGISTRYPVPNYRSSLTLPMDSPMMIQIQLRNENSGT